MEYYARLEPYDETFKLTHIDTIKSISAEPNVITVIWSHGCYKKWCQALIYDLLSSYHVRSSTRTLHVLDDEHEYKCVIDGAVVVNVITEAYEEEALVTYLSKFNGVIFMSGSDEEMISHDIKALDIATFAWRQEVKKDRYPSKVIPYPFGYRTSFPHAIRRVFVPWDLRKNTWGFAGQVQNENRQRMLKNMNLIQGGDIFLTNSFGAGKDLDNYARFISDCKFIPCPKGNCCVDTFRLCEALEAGCIPIVERTSSHHGIDNYFDVLFRSPVPFIVIDDWDEIYDKIKPYIENEIKCMELSNKCWQWWIKYKRDMTLLLFEQVQQIKNIARENKIIDLRNGIVENDQQTVAVNNLVTTIITTSPIVSNPNSDMITAVMESLNSYSELRNGEVIMVFDGCVKKDRYNNYQRYKRQILQLITRDIRFRNIFPIFSTEHLHQANCLRLALDYVTTKNVLIMEHDVRLFSGIDIRGIVNLTTKYPKTYKHILLYHEKSSKDEFGNYYSHIIPERPERLYIEGVPLIVTKQWSMRPHFSPTSYYKDFIMGFIGKQARVFVEDIIWEIEMNQCNLHFKYHEDFGTFVYAPPEGCMRGHEHLDGRREEEKMGMLIAYDSSVPLGAPEPIVQPSYKKLLNQ